MEKGSTVWITPECSLEHPKLRGTEDEKAQELRMGGKPGLEERSWKPGKECFQEEGVMNVSVAIGRCWEYSTRFTIMEVIGDQSGLGGMVGVGDRLDWVQEDVVREPG